MATSTLKHQRDACECVRETEDEAQEQVKWMRTHHKMRQLIIFCIKLNASHKIQLVFWDRKLRAVSWRERENEGMRECAREDLFGWKIWPFFHDSDHKRRISCGSSRRCAQHSLCGGGGDVCVVMATITQCSFVHCSKALCNIFGWRRGAENFFFLPHPHSLSPFNVHIMLDCCKSIRNNWFWTFVGKVDCVYCVLRHTRRTSNSEHHLPLSDWLCLRVKKMRVSRCIEAYVM